MRKIILLSGVLSGILMAEPKYIYNEKVDMLDANSKVIGTIFEGVEVNMIKVSGDKTLVSIKGENIDGNKTALGYSKNGLVPYLELKNDTPKNGMEFWVKNSDLTSNLIEAWDEAELNYYDTCSSCHAAHKPKEHKMDEWDAYISAMQGFAKITDEQKDRIVRFMQSHASDGYVKDE
ncbi:trimethylamine-N-oxide reductase c-type cytochrome TorC [Campylobacter fetus]|uniref:trimethylamine-N-oxide reductase c-type cytochrome TorC n=1 Tax=Campylobacter fetus TaxID=196 RepID=UPI0003C2877C|nr:trimethylamine-N-oxide reductase c-type cytochrome TorC [Campylobacter fetus]AGZ81660.1 molybdopterin-containing oxidoreductase I, DMSO/TMAO/BSO reductase family, monoheme c-type cytochrome [Campylobacter fetus subsp. testudinum 03-427]AJB45399.1 hypothetical protein CR44_04035 [Campylobacter fetus subsp. testudinum]AVK81065.1 hypothetical protein C6B32_04245 [Campylobacter fetus subsp. testudinum]EAI4321362.1 hypothetical protein [Campylobacter fetus]EAI4390618.1 hypothetical protein [Camp